MSKVITLLNRKGGCSKTSTAFSLAVELSKKANTICIDLDDQANLTSWAGITELQYEFADYLLDKCELKDVIRPTKVPNLFILPTAAREGDLRNYADLRAKDEPFRLYKLTRELSKIADYIVIDTSPAWGSLEKAACLASDEIITPLKLDKFSSDGLETLKTNFDKLKVQYDDCHGISESGRPFLNKLVLSEYNASYALSNQLVEAYKPLESTGYKLFIIPQDQAFKKAQQLSIPVQAYSGTKAETLKVIESLAASLAN
ncbi:MAG: ParA family protein [Treponema sp.]|nr:ParA family protein [Treponema sp.]